MSCNPCSARPAGCGIANLVLAAECLQQVCGLYYTDSEHLAACMYLAWPLRVCTMLPVEQPPVAASEAALWSAVACCMSATMHLDRHAGLALLRPTLSEHPFIRR